MTTKFSRFSVRPWGLLSSATLIACIGTGLGFLGRFWWPFELASHFRAQYFLFLLVSAILFLIWRKQGAAILAAVFALVNVSLIAPLYFGNSAIHDGGRVFRAALINVDASNQDYGRLQDFIRSVEPDFLVLAEINQTWLDELGTLRASYPYARARPRADNFGIALLSRNPFAKAEIQYIGDADVPSVVARFEIDGLSFTVIGTHPLPPVGRVLSEHRNRQLAELAQVVAWQEGPVMVLGDLNTTSWSPFFSDLVRATGLRDSRDGFGIQPTWPAGFPLLWVPIDHCLVSSEVVVHDRQTGPNVGSDHYPVVVDFSVDATAPPQSQFQARR